MKVGRRYWGWTAEGVRGKVFEAVAAGILVENNEAGGGIVGVLGGSRREDGAQQDKLADGVRRSDSNSAILSCV